jgi:DNA-binding response OmpR family regulator
VVLISSPPSAATPPVVVVTAMSRARAAEAGAEVVITKPFDVAKLEAAMRQLLGDD